jgi:hypothetical protein
MDANFAQLRLNIAMTESQIDADIRADNRLRQSVLRSRGRGGRLTFGGSSFGARERGTTLPSQSLAIPASLESAKAATMQSTNASVPTSRKLYQHTGSPRGRGFGGYRGFHIGRVGHMAPTSTTRLAPTLFSNETAHSANRTNAEYPLNTGSNEDVPPRAAQLTSASTPFVPAAASGVNTDNPPGVGEPAPDEGAATLRD